MFASLLGVYSKEETQCSWIFKCITCFSCIQQGSFDKVAYNITPFLSNSEAPR